MMSAFSSFTVKLFAAMMMLACVDAAPVSFADRCRGSPQFALFFGDLCDRYLPAQDCQVGKWSAWTTSRNSQNVCTQNRTRKITSRPRNGGKACPELKEIKTIRCADNAEDLLSILKLGLGGFGPVSPGTPRTLAGPAFDKNINHLTSLNRTKTKSVGQKGQRGLHKRAIVSSCPSDRDIVVIVDSSGSVDNSEFTSALNDLSELIPLLCGYQPDEIKQCHAYRLAMITYGSSPKLAFDLDDNLSRHTNQVNVQNDIQTKPEYTGGYTATGDALKFAWDNVLQTARGMRPSSKKTILLLTDGHYNHGTHNPISVAADMFAHFQNQLSIVALGIGDNINYQELIDITNHYNEGNILVYYTETYNSFHVTVETIKAKIVTQKIEECSSDVLAKKR